MFVYISIMCKCVCACIVWCETSVGIYGHMVVVVLENTCAEIFGYTLSQVVCVCMCQLTLSCFPGYIINIYVEMFHSEKQFDELEIFDGTHTYTHTHWGGGVHIFNSCLFMKITTTFNKMHNP